MANEVYEKQLAELSKFVNDDMMTTSLLPQKRY